MNDDILLTGSTGFLGKILHKSFIESGYNVVTLGRSNCLINVDITGPLDISLNILPSFVVHAAGKAHTFPKTQLEKQEFYRVNLQGTKNLCKLLEKAGVLPRAFIFISTVSVYGLDNGEKITEDFPLNGSSPYAESKILAEHWLQEWADKNAIKLGIVRLPLVVGPMPPGNLGAMIAGIQTGKYLSIGNASARKSMVWAEDVAKIIPFLAKKGGIYNLTDGYHPSFRELENIIAGSLDSRKPLRIPSWAAYALAKMGDVIGDAFPFNSAKLQKITSTLIFDDSKAVKELGWNPSPVLTKITEII